AHFESKAAMEIEFLEQKVQYLAKTNKNEEIQKMLTRYTRDFAGATMLRWGELEDEYWGRFGLGF
ncbi:MAG: peptidase, partial [Bacteroidales bacterium]|nr:peptidase [Bacteroidales bacterium]